MSFEIQTGKAGYAMNKRQASKSHRPNKNEGEAGPSARVVQAKDDTALIAEIEDLIGAMVEVCGLEIEANQPASIRIVGQTQGSPRRPPAKIGTISGTELLLTVQPTSSGSSCRKVAISVPGIEAKDLESALRDASHRVVRDGSG